MRKSSRKKYSADVLLFIKNLDECLSKWITYGERNKNILIRYFNSGDTLTEIGVKFEISGARVKLIVSREIRRIEKHLNNKEIEYKTDFESEAERKAFDSIITKVPAMRSYKNAK